MSTVQSCTRPRHTFFFQQLENPARTSRNQTLPMLWQNTVLVYLCTVAINQSRNRLPTRPIKPGLLPGLLPARSFCLLTLSLSEARPGRIGGQSSVTDIYHTIPYHNYRLLRSSLFRQCANTTAHGLQQVADRDNNGAAHDAALHACASLVCVCVCPDYVCHAFTSAQSPNDNACTTAHSFGGLQLSFVPPVAD